VRGYVAVTDLDGLGHAGRPGSQLAQCDIVSAASSSAPSSIGSASRRDFDGADGHTMAGQLIERHREGLADDDHVGIDQPDCSQGVVEPDRQIGPRGSGTAAS